MRTWKQMRRRFLNEARRRQVCEECVKREVAYIDSMPPEKVDAAAAALCKRLVAHDPDDPGSWF